MIKSHFTFLWTRRLEAIVIALFGVLGVFFLAVSSYKEPNSTLLYFQDQYTEEYLLLTTTVVKMVVLLFMVFLWVYATRVNRYDVYLLLREKDTVVIGSKYLVLLGLSVLFGCGVSTLLWLVYLLYPYGVELSTLGAWYQSLVVFIVYYTTLFMVVERLYEPVFGLFIPVIAWFVGMMTVDIFNVNNDGGIGTNYSQLIVPDIVYDNESFRLLFGPYLVLAIGFLWSILVFHIVTRRGVFEFS